jgi:hypothetical protein
MRISAGPTYSRNFPFTEELAHFQSMLAHTTLIGNEMGLCGCNRPVVIVG